MSLISHISHKIIVIYCTDIGPMGHNNDAQISVIFTFLAFYYYNHIDRPNCLFDIFLGVFIFIFTPMLHLFQVRNSTLIISRDKKKARRI